MVEKSFGTLLREARKRAGFHTIREFADSLSERSLAYSDAAVGHWENDQRKPNRDTLLIVMQLLAERGGIISLTEANAMLDALKMSVLTPIEHTTYLASFQDVSFDVPGKPFYSRLVGRDEVVQNIRDVLIHPIDRRVAVISGLGGIGKTAVAYEVIRKTMRSSQRFEQMAWETAKSEEFIGVSIRQRRQQNVSYTGILASYARQLGYESLTTEPPDRLLTGLRKLIRAGNYLIVLDNLETLEAAQQIAEALHELVGESRSRVLITSRERLVDLPFVYDYYLRGLTESDTYAFIRQEAQDRGAQTLLYASPELLKQIYLTTGGMPLALKLIVSQYLLGIALDEELERLRSVTEEAAIYQFIYMSVWGKLSTPAQKLLVSLATFAGSAMRSMVMAVGRMDDTEFNRAVPELVGLSLLEVINHPHSEQQRYDIHAMTRWFVNVPLTDLWNNQKGNRK